MQCPGQNTQFWKQEDIFEVKCSTCDSDIEFFKDDVSRLCQTCGRKTANPKIDFGCAEHCGFADKCKNERG